MSLIRQTKYSSLSEALTNRKHCRTLDLLVERNLVDDGQSFLQLRNLVELNIEGSLSLSAFNGFDLPAEIGQLTALRRLSLLNLPLNIFPVCILKLHGLRYLMIRGTDIKTIPSEIGQLTELETLRLENCPLTSLPSELGSLTKLDALGLSDTKILINEYADTLPLSLRQLNMAGTPLQNINPELTRRKIKLRHVS